MSKYVRIEPDTPKDFDIKLTFSHPKALNTFRALLREDALRMARDIFQHFGEDPGGASRLELKRRLFERGLTVQAQAREIERLCEEKNELYGKLVEAKKPTIGGDDQATPRLMREENEKLREENEKMGEENAELLHELRHVVEHRKQVLLDYAKLRRSARIAKLELERVES